MAMTINSNAASMNAQRNLTVSQSALNTSIQRLSSGMRINSAKDDAAGLAISNRMTSQINGLTQASRNANDGISLAQTAEGGLSTATDILQRMRTLSVQAANSTNSASDRASLQTEVGQLQEELNRVAKTTQFNGQNVLDGTLSNAQFQIGANANQTINFSISSAAATAIGANRVVANDAAATLLSEAKASAASGTFDPNTLGAQVLTVEGKGQTATVNITAGMSGKAAAAAFNAASGSTGVSAEAVTNATLGGFSAGTVSLTLQGAPKANGSANPVTINATVASTSDLSSVISAINEKTGSTGITAVAGKTAGTIELTQADGEDIGVANNTTSTTLTVTGRTATGAAGTAVTLAAGGAAGDNAVVGAQVNFSSSSGFSISSDTANAGIFAAASTANASTLSAVGSIDITKMTSGTPTGANDALKVIDAALASIDDSRAKLGAMQNRFQMTIANLDTTTENLSASRGRIQDTDFAKETANMTRNQILQQAGTAMLAQANQLPNNVLSLLR